MNRRKLVLAGPLFQDGFTTRSPGDAKSSFGEDASETETISIINSSVKEHVKTEVRFHVNRIYKQLSTQRIFLA